MRPEAILGTERLGAAELWGGVGPRRSAAALGDEAALLESAARGEWSVAHPTLRAGVLERPVVAAGVVLLTVVLVVARPDVAAERVLTGTATAEARNSRAGIGMAVAATPTERAAAKARGHGGAALLAQRASITERRPSARTLLRSTVAGIVIGSSEGRTRAVAPLGGGARGLRGSEARARGDQTRSNHKGTQAIHVSGSWRVTLSAYRLNAVRGRILPGGAGRAEITAETAERAWRLAPPL